MDDLCDYCGQPIIFRYNPPQVYHVGTGWYCWKARNAENDDAGGAPDAGLPDFPPPPIAGERLAAVP